MTQVGIPRPAAFTVTVAHNETSSDFFEISPSGHKRWWLPVDCKLAATYGTQALFSDITNGEGRVVVLTGGATGSLRRSETHVADRAGHDIEGPPQKTVAAPLNHSG